VSPVKKVAYISNIPQAKTVKPFARTPTLDPSYTISGAPFKICSLMVFIVIYMLKYGDLSIGLSLITSTIFNTIPKWNRLSNRLNLKRVR